MNEQPTFTLADTEEARLKADYLFEEVSSSLSAQLPSSEILHVGATAIPGCLTKGDLDIVVRVAKQDFAKADKTLASLYARNEGSVKTADFSAFEDKTCDPHLGIQLVVIEGQYDFFHRFTDLLRTSPDLLDRYNELKVKFSGSKMDVYRKAKDAFINEALAGGKT